MEDEISARKKHLFHENKWLILGLCLFIALLSFKPSEAYLSAYLICNKSTQTNACSESAPNSCDSPCFVENGSCQIVPCSNVSSSICGNSDFYYCSLQNGICADSVCYKNFSEDEVNNEIYPWSTYAYLPFLVLFGPFAEIYSYRIAIIFGIFGRVVTRFLLLFGTTLSEMQIMQVTYAMGTAAEDVFSAYLYYITPPELYTEITSYVRTSALLAFVVSGVLGDILVTQFQINLQILMVLSAIFVTCGAVLGIFVIKQEKNHFVRESLPPTSKSTITIVMNEEIESPLSPSSSLPSLSDPLLQSPSNVTNNTLVSPLHCSESSFPDPQSKEREYTSFTHSHSPRSRPSHPPIKPNSSFTSYQTQFKQQVNFFLTALRSPFLLSLTIYWIVGNAVYMILYSYEVSIFLSLDGSNDWNGSVLSLMLLAGSVGSMLPTWLKTDQMSPRELLLSLSFFEVVSLVSLYFSISLWTLIPTIALLTFYFFGWNFINVLFFAQLALGLKSAQHTQSEHYFSSNPYVLPSRTPSTSEDQSIVTSSSSSTSQSSYLSFIHKQQLQPKPAPSFSSVSSSADERESLVFENNLRDLLHSSLASSTHNTPPSSRRDGSPSKSNQNEAELDFPSRTPSPASPSPDHQHHLALEEVEIAEPAYSVIVVFCIILCVILQIVLLFLLFEWYGFDMQIASLYLMYVHLGATALHLLSSLSILCAF